VTRAAEHGVPHAEPQLFPPFEGAHAAMLHEAERPDEEAPPGFEPRCRDGEEIQARHLPRIT
jgi:hypothetical protein